MVSRILLSVPYMHITCLIFKYFTKRIFLDPQYPIHILSELGNLVFFWGGRGGIRMKILDTSISMSQAGVNEE